MFWCRWQWKVNEEKFFSLTYLKRVAFLREQPFFIVVDVEIWRLFNKSNPLSPKPEITI